jgi:hypothetical protein
MENTGSAVGEGPGNLLGYRREMRRRRWSWRWVLVLLGCHVVGSYGIAGAWAVHQVVTKQPWNMPWGFVAALPLVSLLVLLKTAVGIVMFPGKAWDTAGAVWAGYVAGFGLGMAVGLAGMAWRGRLGWTDQGQHSTSNAQHSTPNG